MGFFQILSWFLLSSRNLGKFSPFLFGFWEIFPDSLTFSWTFMDSSKSLGFSRFLQILPDFFSYPVRIWLDSLVFFWILSDLDFFGLSSILSESLLILWILSDSLLSYRNLTVFSWIWPYSPVHSQILSNSLSEILSDSTVVSPILSEFANILLYSLGLLRAIHDSLGIWLHSLIFSRIPLRFFTHSFRNFRISNCFGFSRILLDSVKFSLIFSDSVRLSRVILDSSKLIRILPNSPGFFWILPYSFRFSSTLLHSSKFSAFLHELRMILPFPLVFPRFTHTLSNSLEFSFEIDSVPRVLFQIL